MLNTSDKLNIKVLGTATSSHQMVVKQIKDYLTRANIPFDLQEVTDIALFIQQGLESIPSINVDGEMITLKNNGSFNKSLRMALNRILKKKNYGELEKFVIPIDFSDVSLNAFIYGHRLASEVGAITKALHVYFPSSSELSQSAVVDVDFGAIRKGYLDEFVSKMDLDWGSDLMKVGLIDKEFRTGFPGEEIIDSVKEHGGELVIMGTTGDSSRIKKWFGSVSTKLINESPVPLLLIPEGASYKGVYNVMFAFDDIKLDMAVIDQLIAFASAFDCNIHLVHMQEEKDFDPGFYLQEQIRNNYSAAKIELVSLSNEDVVEALSDYANENLIDVIAMATQQRSFFNRVFHDSVTTRMSLHSNIPLLILKGKS